MIRGHGIPEAMEAILTKQSRIAPRTAVAKPVSAAMAIGTGAPFGAEGPIIVTGGALGSLLGQVIRVSPSERKILLAAGAAAGMAATFGAPLAAVVLAIELLLFEFSTRAFVPLVVAASVAGGMHVAALRPGPVVQGSAAPLRRARGASRVHRCSALGAGLLARAHQPGLVHGRGLVPALARRRVLAPGDRRGDLRHDRSLSCPAHSAWATTPSATCSPTSSRSAPSQSSRSAKLLAWWAALGSGTSGGTLAPILLISAGYGSLFGAAVTHLFPGLDVSPGAFAVVAMAATFGAATRATFTAMVFVFELTRDYDVILPLMLATVIADLVAGALMRDSIMTEKLTRRGLRVHTDYEVDPFRTVPISDIMTTTVVTLPASRHGRRCALPVRGRGPRRVSDRRR